MNGKPTADIGFMTLTDASYYIADRLGETLDNKYKNNNKFTRYIKKHIELHPLGVKYYQVSKHDVEKVVEHFSQNPITLPAISNQIVNNLISLISLKEQEIINSDQFYEAVKKLL